jgi:hypothetical protein
MPAIAASQEHRNLLHKFVILDVKCWKLNRDFHSVLFEINGESWCLNLSFRLKTKKPNLSIIYWSHSPDGYVRSCAIKRKKLYPTADCCAQFPHASIFLARRGNVP